MNEMPTRHICTKDDPWSPDKGEWATHPEAEYFGYRDFELGEYREKYHCPHCGHSFYVELPQ